MNDYLLPINPEYVKIFDPHEYRPKLGVDWAFGVHAIPNIPLLASRPGRIHQSIDPLIENPIEWDKFHQVGLIDLETVDGSFDRYLHVNRSRDFQVGDMVNAGDVIGSLLSPFPRINTECFALAHFHFGSFDIIKGELKLRKIRFLNPYESLATRRI